MLDASIFQRFQRKSPLDFEQERNALETSKLNRELNKQRIEENQLALATKKREQEEGNRLQELQRGMSGVDPKEYSSRYRQAGFFKQADEADKTRLSLEKDTTDIAEKKSKISKEQLDTIKTKTELAGHAWGFVRNNPTPEAADRVLNSLVENQIYTPEQAQKYRDAIAQNPANVGQFAEQAFTSVLQAKDQLAKFETRNLGGTSRVESINPVTGKRSTVAEDKITESENNRLSREQQARESAASRAVTMRGQNMSDARARQSIDAGAQAAISDAGGVAQAALNKQLGKPPAGFRWKTDGSLEAIPGGPSDRKANEQLAGKETVDTVIASLRDSYGSLEKGGGITSTAKGSASNIGAAISRSGLGQAVGGTLGTKNQKERDSIAQTRPLLLQAIMKATGMSAKQMDSNAELKLYLATATDPTLSLEANRQALDTLERLYGSGGGRDFGKPPEKPAENSKIQNLLDKYK